MEESVDYKGLFWDEDTKKVYTWAELKEIWKQRKEQNKDGRKKQSQKNLRSN